MKASWLLVVSVVGCSGADLPAPSSPTPRREAARIKEPAAYDRRAWRHWIDADHDCQDTRQEVLIAESEVPVEFVDARHCRVKRGRWTCPYTGRVVTDPGLLDIDHLVPLENADRSGGSRWPAAKKQAYANDLDHPEHLVAVVAIANRQKGSSGPDVWLPPNRDAACAYVTAWLAIKLRWALASTDAESAAAARVVERVVERCRRVQP